MMRTFLAAPAIFLSLSAPALAQPIPALPKEMLGVWGFDTESCANKDSDGRQTVESRSVTAFASVFELKTIKRQADGAVRASATVFEEGEERKRRGSIELKLVSPDQLSVKRNRDEPMIYLRCKTPGKTG